MFTSPLNFHNKIKVSDYLHLRDKKNQASETEKIICSRSYNKWVGELQSSCFQSLPAKYSMDSKEIKPVNPKGKQPEIFIGRTAAEAEAPILWPPDMESQLIGKDPDAGKDWRVEEKGKTEDEIVGWYHQLNGHEFEQTPGDGEGQGSLECCSPWGHNWATEEQSMFSYGSLHTYTHTPIPNYVFLQS